MDIRSVSHRKLHISIILIVGFFIIGSTIVILSFVAKNQFWNHSHLQDAVLSLEEYNEIIVENDTSLNKTEKIVREYNEIAQPVRGEFSNFFESCNQSIAKCFQDIYGIDITSKLDALQIMEATYPENVSQMVGGSYYSDFPDKLFMNTSLLDSFILDDGTVETLEITSTELSVKMLRTVYIHEVIHYLGFNSDSGFDHFTEAIAEYLNQKVTQHNGIKYESITGYATIQGYAAQIIECDPEFVKNVLSNDNADMDKYFNMKLKDNSDINYAEYYDKLIGLIQTGSIKDLNRIKYYTQYFTYEYCKAANNNARTINQTIRENAVSLFEIKWLLKIF